MEYRVVYDVLEDGLLPAWSGSAVFFLVVTLAFAVIQGITFFLQRRSRGTIQRKKQVSWVAMMILGMLPLLGAWWTYDLWRDQAQCKEWARAGQYRVTEGVISHAIVGRPSYFQVASVNFHYYTVHGREGGFRGEYTVPNPPPDRLHDGQSVRIRSQDGHILRVEIKEKD